MKTHLLSIVLLLLQITNSWGQFTNQELAFPSKKGIGQTLKQFNDKKFDTNLHTALPFIEKLNLGWNYSWGSDLVNGQPSDVQFMPMTFGYNLKKHSDFISKVNTIQSLINAGVLYHVFGFNEPDKPKQANMTVQEAIDVWPLLESLGVPLVSPSCKSPFVDWMTEFMHKIDSLDYRVDYIGVHNYPGPGIQAFKDRMQRVYDLYNKPIVITEFAIADWSATTPEENKFTPARVLEFMKGVLPWMEQQSWITGYAWFPFETTRAVGTSSALVFPDGRLTQLGKYYASVTPQNPSGDLSIQAEDYKTHPQLNLELIRNKLNNDLAVDTLFTNKSGDVVSTNIKNKVGFPEGSPKNSVQLDTVLWFAKSAYMSFKPIIETPYDTLTGHLSFTLRNNTDKTGEMNLFINGVLAATKEIVSLGGYRTYYFENIKIPKQLDSLHIQMGTKNNVSGRLKYLTFTYSYQKFFPPRNILNDDDLADTLFTNYSGDVSNTTIPNRVGSPTGNPINTSASSIQADTVVFLGAPSGVPHYMSFKPNVSAIGVYDSDTDILVGDISLIFNNQKVAGGALQLYVNGILESEVNISTTGYELVTFPDVEIPEMLDSIHIQAKVGNTVWGNMSYLLFTKTAQTITNSSNVFKEPEIEYNIFPNPAQSSISLSNVKEGSLVKIIDYNGIIVLEESYKDNISLSSLNSGIFFISIYSDKQLVGQTRKLIVKK